MVPESMNKGPKPQKSVRVKFTKTGSLKFISHLDLNRTMQEVIVRSKLPVWYSEGFNPHPRIVFSPPLSVGVSSLTEFMDFKLVEEVPENEIVERLNSAFPKGLAALSCYVPETRFSDIKWGLYEIKYYVENIPDDISSRVKSVLTADSIIVEKKTKSGDAKSVDISSGIRDVDAELCEDKTLKVSVKLSCGENSFVNPRFISETLIKKIPEVFYDVEETVCRVAVYTENGETLFS